MSRCACGCGNEASPRRTFVHGHNTRGIGGYCLTPEQHRQRFDERVKRGAPDECWPWLGTIARGYGSASLTKDGGKKKIPAHRLAWQFANDAEIPAGMYVMHSCDNPPCCNPAHLSLGTHVDNARDMFAKGRSANQRKTHCPRGHEYTPENTANWTKDQRAKRECRKCIAFRRSAHGKALRAASKEASL